jgi:hypothetical protein
VAHDFPAVEIAGGLAAGDEKAGRTQ